MAAEIKEEKKTLSNGHVEVFERRNVFYRSIERLKKKKKKPQTPPVSKCPQPRNRSVGSVSESVVSNSHSQSPSLNKMRLPGMQPSDQVLRTRDRSDSGRKGSAPADMIRSPTKKEPPTAAKKEKSRPFSLFVKKPESPKAPSSPKPDHFMDVKLKKTVTEQKLVPKTTEKTKLFEGVYQVSLTAELDETTGKVKLKPFLSWSHPPLGTTKCRNIAATEKIVPDFAFPDLDLLEVKNIRLLSETYAFVQTDMSAARTIGYCRRFKYKETPASRLRSGTDASVTQSHGDTQRKVSRKQKRLLKIRVWCIVTKLHCFDTFSMIFDEIHKMRRETTSNADSEVFSFLKAIGESASPLPGHSVQIQYVSKMRDDNALEVYEVKRPGPDDRITLLKHANLLNRLSKNMLIKIMTALFTESKVLFLDKTLSSLTSTLHALTSLLYPLEWVCIYIPMLSVGIRALVRDLVQSPSPYVIGMLKDDYSKVREYELKDTQVLVVDLTRRELLEMRDEDQAALPICDASRKELKQKLREVKHKKDQTKQGDLWRDFLKPFLSVIDELCFDAEKVDGIRRIAMSAYIEAVTKTKPGDVKFAEKLFSTQMSQMWLQKQRLAISI